ncbi:MAG: repressor LexA [Nitrosomonas sp.]|nr:MAG: repressor LexA [Nitrosomonas sp.]
MKGLTKRQREIINFIEGFIQKNGFSPSYKEIMEHFGFSSFGSVHCHLRVLRRKGFVAQEEGCSRSIVLTSTKESAVFGNDVECSLIGFITGNGPIETFPQIQSIALPAFLVPNPEISYILRAKGDTLLDENIADGDLIIFETTTNPNPGDTVIAVLEGNTTIVKRYYPEGQYISLKSASIKVEPQLLQADKVTLRGVVVALFRFYS